MESSPLLRAKSQELRAKSQELTQRAPLVVEDKKTIDKLKKYGIIGH
jgi:hypothetical protein